MNPLRCPGYQSGMKTAFSLIVVIAMLCGALCVSGVTVLIWRQEPYGGTDYVARCIYTGANGLTRTDHRFSTLAEMQRFGCAWWRRTDEPIRP